MWLGLFVFFILLMPVSGMGQPEDSHVMHIGTNFWFIIRNGEQPWKEGVDFTTTEDPWDTVYLERLKPYSVLRFMDWGGTNNSPLVHWSDRTQKHDPHQAGGYNEKGIAYEWMIDLGNRLHKDIWICVPHKADSFFIASLARLIHDHLDTTLKCYIEYSNETWNPMFQQAVYAQEQGTARGWNSGENGEWKARFMWHDHMAAKVFSIFHRVFGPEMKNRIVKVISGFHAWVDMDRFQIDHILDPQVNPDSILPDAFATAPYVGHDITGADFEGFRKNLTEVAGKAAQIKTYLREKLPGMRFITYEGGQHVLNGADVFSRDPECYDVYMQMLDSMSRYYDLFVHYAHCGIWRSDGAWGSMEYKTQPLEQAHKYRALKDWVERELPTQAYLERAPASCRRRIQIIPNPTSGLTRIYPEPESGKTELEIFNMSGTRITTNIEKGQDSFSVNFAGIPNGVYVVRLISGISMRTGVVILQK